MCVCVSGSESLLQAVDDADGVRGRSSWNAFVCFLHPAEDLGGNLSKRIQFLENKTRIKFVIELN